MLKPTAVLVKEVSVLDQSVRYVVNTNWTNTAAGVALLDRPCTGGMSCGSDLRLAMRLLAAIDAGLVYTKAEIRRDIAGKSYVSADSCVMGRYLNSDLKKLGY